MCATCVLICVGVLQRSLSVWSRCVWFVCAHVQKKPMGSTANPGRTFKARQGTKLMFSDCECIQYVSRRREQEWLGAMTQRQRVGRGGWQKMERWRAGREEIQMTGKEAEVQTLCYGTSWKQNKHIRSEFGWEDDIFPFNSFWTQDHNYKV